MNTRALKWCNIMQSACHKQLVPDHFLAGGGRVPRSGPDRAPNGWDQGLPPPIDHIEGWGAIHTQVWEVLPATDAPKARPQIAAYGLHIPQTPPEAHPKRRNGHKQHAPAADYKNTPQATF